MRSCVKSLSLRCWLSWFALCADILALQCYCMSIHTVAEVVRAEELSTVALRASSALLERLLSVPVSTTPATHHHHHHHRRLTVNTSCITMYFFSFFLCLSSFVSLPFFLVAIFDGLRPLLLVSRCLPLCSLANKLRSFVHLHREP